VAVALGRVKLYFLLNLLLMLLLLRLCRIIFILLDLKYLVSAKRNANTLLVLNLTHAGNDRKLLYTYSLARRLLGYDNNLLYYLAEYVIYVVSYRTYGISGKI
jgi:hypothetical protein